MTAVPSRRAPRPGASPVRVALRALAVAVVTLASATAPLALAAPSGPDAAAAPATGDLTWSVRPADNDLGAGRPNFAYELAPGDVVEDALVVTNLGATPLELQVYAADAFTTASGHLDLLPDGEPSTDLGTWVTSPAPTLTLEGAQSVEVPFTLTVPADAAPGDHPGGIVTSFVQAADGDVRLDRRLGSRIHVRVAGETTLTVAASDVVTSLSPSPVPWGTPSGTVTATVTNTGDVRAVVAAGLVASSPTGSVTRTAEPVEVMPGSAVPVAFDVGDAWLLGPVDVDLTVTTTGVDGSVADPAVVGASIVVVPWSALVLVALVVAVAVVIGVRRARRGRGEGAAA
ncbi:WxL protein peptidoglycan domain-containing protein [Litorihabitans aurantiacus]|uniref:DUF916 domain-containing protein n=1 Tax=Litorihabitans aurantiacus TaxID=1930061 RepID=A0AA38CW83_9MICO|nr:DUF916 domain-containing protein [Litorihabitans aurantiacus]GMA32772.1 hypothetical protein GCM10025875_27640 [Litorihabitans aurantiacus]